MIPTAEDRGLAPIRWSPLIPLFLVLAAFVAYANSLSAVFIFDDHTLVVNDLRLRQLATSLSATTRPLTRLTFFLNYWIAGVLKASDLRAVNVIIHTAAGLFLFGLVRRTLKLPSMVVQYGRSADRIAGLISALWLVHPLQTESVTYIMQRAESLMGLLFLLTLYFAARGFREPVDHRWYTAAIASSALCMASKPVAVTLPIVVLLYDRTFAAGSFRAAMHRRWSLYCGLAATWLVLITILSKPNESTTSTGVGNSLPTPLQYFLTQQHVVLHYLRLAVFPRGLCLDYAWPPVQSWTSAILPGLAMAGFFGVTLWWLIRNRPAGFAGMWFFLNLAPTSSFLPVADCAFEHRMYLPLAGVVVLIVGGAWNVLRERTGSFSRGMMGLTVVSLLAILTIRRNMDYRSELAMWSDVVAKRPANLRARNDLAVALSEAGYVSEAIAEYKAVLDRIPAEARRALDAGTVVERGLVPADSYSYHYFRSHTNLGWLLFKELGRSDEAVKHLVLALRVIPYHASAREMLKEVLRRSGIPEWELDGEILRRLQGRQP